MAKSRASTRPKSHKASATDLVSVLDIVRYAATRFGKARLAYGQGTHNAVEDAIFLVAETLGLPVNGIEPFLPARLTPAERKALLALIERRIAERLPVAYLVGRAHLQDLSFHVDSRVIIPRSFLAEILTGELFAGDSPLIDTTRVTRVLDLCTGSGCLAVLACHVFPNATVDAVDISADAAAVAKINIAEHGLGDRITLYKGDLLAPLGGATYDVIISNPPYVDAGGMAALPPEYRHEPRRALAAGSDGLDIVRRILAEAGDFLSADGGLLCEIGRCRPAIETDYPDLEFLWLDTEESSGEVFWLPAAALRR